MFDIKAIGTEKVIGMLRDAQKQMAFATAVSITRTAALAKNAISKEMESVFDRPTPYTMRALYSTRATPANQKAMVLFREFGGTPAEKYLGPQVYGGVRGAKRFEIALRHAKYPLPAGMYAVPASGAKLDAYGNILPGQITQILSRLKVGNVSTRSASRRSTRKAAQVDYFIGRPAGGGLPYGVYQRTTFAFGSAIRPVLLFVKQPSYRKRLHFFEVGQSVVDRELSRQFGAALDEAMRTAR